MAVAKQQVMPATATIALLNVCLQGAICCGHGISLQVDGFALVSGNKLWQCFRVVLKWNTMRQEDLVQQKH